MISIVKYLFESNSGVVDHLINFLTPAKKVVKTAATNIADKPTSFATQAIYNTPAGQESEDQMLTRLSGRNTTSKVLTGR